MIMTQLQGIANTVVRRAQRQGYIIPRQVREELAGAGLADELWKDVIALAGPSLAYRQGRYHYVSVISARREEEERHQQAVHRAVRQLIRAYRTEAARSDRRQHERVEFVQPVKVQSEDLRECTLLCRDISTAGLRLIGTRSLLGQKVRVTIARGSKAEPCRFLVRILWTCAVGEDLFENGGAFLQTLTAQEAGPLKVVS